MDHSHPRKEKFEDRSALNHRSADLLRQELENKNSQLEVQTRQLTEILKINEVLRLDLELEDILDKVAKAIQRSLEFRRILISLYDRNHHVFVRKAQAGLSAEEFQRAREQRVPKESVFQFFQEKYEVSNSFFVSHQEGLATEYDVETKGGPITGGGWHPDDYLLVPLVSADRRLLGVISVDGPSDGRVPDLQTIGVLELFANQAAQAVVNVTLYERAKSRARALETLGTISKQIGAQLEFDPLLERMVEIIKAHLSCRYCAVLLWDDQTNTWTVGAPKNSAPSLTVELHKVDHVIQQVAQRGKPLISEQLEKITERERFFESAQFSAFLPLKVKERLIGLLIIVGQQEMAFSDKDELFWNSLSDQMATAIGNAQLYQNAKYYSITDGLTGLYNHRHFQERLGAEENRSRRHGHCFSVIMLDIDHFKHYNDVCGHPTGDKALTIIAQQIMAEVRNIDIVARYGGEEFTIILTETDKAGAWKVAERIRKKVADHKFPHGQMQPQKHLTVSIGVATFPDDADNRKDLMERADEAMYIAKKLGRNRVFLCGQSEGTWSLESMSR
jgi:diguanylate cyclase (GGDEF)-like protein